MEKMSDTNQEAEIKRLELEKELLKEQLKSAEQKYTKCIQALNSTSLPICIIDLNYKLTYINQAFKSTFNRIEGVILKTGKSFLQTILHSKFSEWETRFQRVFLGEKLEIEEAIQQNQETQYFKLTIEPVVASHQIQGAQILIQDITTEKNEQLKYEDTSERLNHVFHLLHGIYYEVGVSGEITMLSTHRNVKMSYLLNDLLGKDVGSLYGNISEREKFLNQITENGKVDDYGINLKDKDDSIKNLSVNARFIKGKNGQPDKVAGIIRDITEIERNNKNLNWFRRAIEHSPTSIMIVSTAGLIEYVNPFFTKITGYSKNEAIGKNPSFLKSNKHNSEFYKHLWNTITKGDIWEGEILNIHKNGSPFWEHATISPVMNKKGEIINFIGIKEDITESKKRIHEIKELKRFNERIVNTIHEGILVEDKNGDILFTNPSFLKMTGYELSDLIGKRYKEIIPSQFHSLIDLNSQKRKNKPTTSISHEIEVRKKDGQLIPVLVGSSPIIENQKNNGVITVYSDISQLKSKEKELKKALLEAQKSDKLKTSFLANMSHEIRTPMNSILGFSELLRTERDLEESERDMYFSIIEEKGYELLHIINDIIEISKIEAQLIDIKNEHFDLDVLMNSVFKTFQHEARFTRKTVKLNLIKFENEAVKPLIIQSDKLRINQILSNLIFNALKFTDEGSIEFGYKNKGSHIEFQVKDTGIGISKKDKEIIFARFRQADNNYTRNHGGNGLGLNICKNLVCLLGGKIWVDSVLGKGSTFYFSIPKALSHKLCKLKKYRGLQPPVLFV